MDTGESFWPCAEATREDATCGHKAKDITPSIARRRKAGAKPRTSHRRSPGGERRAQSQGHQTSIARRRKAGAKPRTSHCRSPGGERRAQSQGHHTVDRQEEKGRRKAKDITPSIARRRKAGTKPRTSHHRSQVERGVGRGSVRRSTSEGRKGRCPLVSKERQRWGTFRNRVIDTRVDFQERVHAILFRKKEPRLSQGKLACFTAHK